MGQGYLDVLMVVGAVYLMITAWLALGFVLMLLIDRLTSRITTYLIKTRVAPGLFMLLWPLFLPIAFLPRYKRRHGASRVRGTGSLVGTRLPPAGSLRG